MRPVRMRWRWSLWREAVSSVEPAIAGADPGTCSLPVKPRAATIVADSLIVAAGQPLPPCPGGGVRAHCWPVCLPQRRHQIPNGCRREWLS
jgi:hypothetical protein